jgi:hypothetical protein
LFREPESQAEREVTREAAHSSLFFHAAVVVAVAADAVEDEAAVGLHHLQGPRVEGIYRDRVDEVGDQIVEGGRIANRHRPFWPRRVGRAHEMVQGESAGHSPARRAGAPQGQDADLRPSSPGP